MSVEIWKASVTQAQPEIPQLMSVLSADEVCRTEQYRVESARRRFIVGRGILRYLLADRLRVPAKAIRFQRGDAGKPRVFDALETEQPAFNLTHSRDIVLIALAEGSSPVGIDVEWKGSARDTDAVVRQFGNDRERDAYMALPRVVRHLAFLYWWTRKEALIKAEGLSLGRALRLIDVPLDARPYHRIVVPLPDGHRTKREGTAWWVHTWVIDQEYVASVAMQEQPCPKGHQHPKRARIATPEEHCNVPVSLLTTL